MNRSAVLYCLVMWLSTSCAIVWGQSPAGETDMRIGIIGLDTSHAVAFTKEFNGTDAPSELQGMRVVAAYPQGSADIQSSVQRVPEYTRTVQELGVRIVDSIDQLVEQVDAVLLESNDGRPHLEQALPVFRARKPMFIDKPLAGSLTDAVAIFLAAEHFQSPVFSSSSLRYLPGAPEARQGAVGDVLGCDAFSPCSLEETHPDLYWYGIHGVELLFTVMGTGCQQVRRVAEPGTDLVVGVWDQGRIGTFRGIRPPAHHDYGGTVFGSTGTQYLGKFAGYGPLVVQIGLFFRSGQPPVSKDETLEIFAFMTAADVSKQQGGAAVSIESVLAEARAAAVPRLQALGVELGQP
ncbi:MAG: Gfo/Idh/MocA family oxidoreductase [Planctomycetaceae bacterium]|nr:Gfo/Idh/MocA family oxidoreductase [Planctomycetaceae bacterium]